VNSNGREATRTAARRPGLRELWSAEDAMAPFRLALVLQLSLLGVAALVPFAVFNLWGGRTAVGAVVAVAALVLGLNARHLHRHGRPPVPYALSMLALHATVCVAISLNGFNSVPWAYPALFINFFVLERRMALAQSLLLLVAVSAVVAVFVGMRTMAPVAATLLFTLLMINVVLSVIGRLQQQLLELTITDPLTGAFNRRHFDALLQALPAAPVGVDASGILVLFDVDHFKSINDEYGHPAGDKVLRGLVQTLSERKRSGDALFRVGGEEFALLLERTSPQDALLLAQKLLHRVEKAQLLPQRSVTISAGMAVRGHNQSTQEWLAAADLALYAAKQQGRNRVVVEDQPSRDSGAPSSPA
jgi:diguanylate cyclase (GGDEF)-like protein